MDVLFGGMPDAARFVVAFVLVLVLLGAGAFLWRKFGIGTLTPTGPRGRQPRLAVIDAASVDGRRRLVLIRRDNTEHLLMIGGPTDIVVEPNITRGGSNAAAREPRPIPTADIPPRPTSPLESPAWGQSFEPPQRPIRSMEELDAVPPVPAQRSAREAMADTMRAMRSEPAARAIPAAPSRLAHDDEITAPALTPPPMPEPGFHPAIAEPRRPALAPVPPPPPPPPAYEPVFQTAPEPRRVPPPPPPPPPPPYEPVFQTAPEPRRMPIPPSQEPAFQAMPEPPPPAHEPVFQSGAAEPRHAAAMPRQSQADENNLAEMAQRLEAALRRPTQPVEPPPPPPPPAAPPPAARPAAAPTSRAAAYFETPRAAAREPPPIPPSELKILSGPAKGEPPFESLEDEMAKMLGRTPGKT
jgi:flagellar protein FliO/FliZ